MSDMATIADTNSGIAAAMRIVATKLATKYANGEMSASIDLFDLVSILDSIADAIDGGDDKCR